MPILDNFLGFMSMMIHKNDIEPEEIIDEEPNAIIIDTDTRPKTFNEYECDSNKQAVDILRDAVSASRIQGTIPPHILLFGPAGTGKTTLAKIIAKECGDFYFLETIGSSVKTQQDIMSIMLKVWEQQGEKNVILFIDEVHDLAKSRSPITQWYTILEDFVFYHSLRNKSIDGFLINEDKLNLNPFTVIGATTDPADLSQPMRDRFGVHCVLKPYSLGDLKNIVKMSAKKRGYAITSKATLDIAMRGRNNPRVSISFLESAERKRVVSGAPKINVQIVEQLFKGLNIDENGLNESDMLILKTLYEHSKGIGARSLAGIVNIDQKSLVDMHLSYLDRLGLTTVTHKRFITDKGKEYIKDIIL